MRHLKNLTSLAIMMVVCILYGCASAPPKVNKDVAAPPKINISPEIELLNMSAKAVSAVLDTNGKAHVLIATSDPRELHYLVINPQGVVHREIIKNTGSFDHLDTAFDREGRLHAIVDNDHLVFEKEVWREIPRNRCQRFVQGGNELVCTFTASGKDVGAPGRWDVYGFASGMGGCIWPWYTHPSKAVLIRKTPSGWSDWTVLDPKTKLGIETFKAVSDDSGTVQIVYQRGRGGFIASGGRDARIGYSQVGYARLESNSGILKLDSIDVKNPSNGEFQKSFAEIEGYVINLPHDFDEINHDIAADRETGVILIAYKSKNAHSYNSCLIRNGVADDCEDDFLSGLYFQIYLASAGSQKFHAVIEGEWRNPWAWTLNFPLYYLEYRNNRWSSPVEVAAYLNEWKAGELVKLISDRSGRAVLIWPKKGKKLALRWIEPSR